MENNKNNKRGIFIGLGIVLACLLVIGVGFGSYYLVRNYGQDAIAQYINGVPGISEPDTPVDIPDFDSPAPTATPWNPELPAPDPDLSGNFETFWTVRTLLHDNYLYQPIDDELLASGAVNGINLYLESLEINPQDISLPEDAPTAEETASRANTPEEIFETFLPFWETWNKLNYVDLPEDATTVSLMRHAIFGMVDALDEPYTNYYDPQLSQQFQNDLSGEYEGIGAFVDVEAEYLTIISPIKDTPAEEAGLRAGDEIIAIDGKDMTGVDPNVALSQVLGPAGTKVVLTIQREGEEPFDVEIIRRKITIPYIESEMRDDGVAYLHLLRFYDGAELDIRAALEELLAQNPTGLIFDLRGNPGGYLHTVVNITSDFIDDGVVLYEVFNDGTQREYPTIRTSGIATEIPLVVLIDGGSASASEIFAGAIKDYERGTLVGETTFGKGLVQMPITLPDDNGMVSITIANWLTPHQEHIQGVGISPDVEVIYTQEDADAGADPALDKAVEILLNQE